MPKHPARLARSLVLAVLLVLLLPARARAETPSASPTGFAGRWALAEETSENPVTSAEKPDEGTGRGGRGGRGGSRGSSVTAMDLPLEAVADAQRLMITDDGFAIRISYPAARTRTFFLDGEERELDDGDGPAKVTAKAKGSRHEKLVVSSSWSDGHGLKETWELLSSPRRLVVEGSVKGRHSFNYKRIYLPAPDPLAEKPAPAISPVPTSVPAVVASPPPAPAASVPASATSDCAIRPPRGTSPDELSRMAKISSAEAERRAVASVAPLKVGSIISSSPEVHDGCLVWPFDLRLPDKGGVQEVFIDAGDGKVLSSTFESLGK
jgi:hypothetical protein